MSTAVREPLPARENSAVSEARARTVESARQVWIKKLIDLSRRNNLLYFRPLKTGTLEFPSAPPEKLRDLLAGEGVALSKLAFEVENETLSKISRDIQRRALENLEEKGLSTLFVVFGVATWPATDGGRPTEAPVLLLPVSLTKKEGSNSYHLSATGSFQLNLVLLHVLQDQFKLKLQPEELLTKFSGDPDDGTVMNIGGLCDEIRRDMAETNGFDIALRVILGNFAFQKMAMVKDLRERGNELAAHDVIAAIAGDTGAKTGINAEQREIQPSEFDSIPPDNEFLVLDADSSQQQAIATVVTGQSRVIHGPPGTGKSQTITNLIATLAATGRRVLFVAEKKAALDVVKHRLEQVGLGHLGIVLHGADISPKKVMQQVAHTLGVVRSSVPVDCRDVHSKVEDRRNRLNSHVARMHVRREPTGKSVYEMQGSLLRFSHFVSTSTRWRGPELARLGPPIEQKTNDLFTEASGLAALFLRTDPSAWTGAALKDGADVDRAVDLVRHIDSESLPQLLGSINALRAEYGFQVPESAKACTELRDLIESISTTLLAYSPEIYTQDVQSLMKALAPGTRSRISSVWAWCTSRPYREARNAIVRLRRAGKTSSAILLVELSRIEHQTQNWVLLSNSRTHPTPIANSEDHITALQSFVDELRSLSAILPSKELDSWRLTDIGPLISALSRDQVTPFQIPKLTEIENRLNEAGISKLVTEIRSKKTDSSLWGSMFLHAWYSSTLDELSVKDSAIRGFVGSTHSRYVNEFSRFDEDRIGLAAERVRRAHGEKAIAAMNANPAGEQLIRAEAAKSTRHMPLRRVFSQAADVLTAVCPCWMASPLSVSQLLDGGRRYFDFVIFDEASQVLPEDAVPSVLRGEKLVVAGDSKQLPPTTFFSPGGEDDLSEEDSVATEGYESLLDAMNSFLNGSYLDWHYRSRDESLINFSNYHMYQNRLVTFPGPGGAPCIKHIAIAQELGTDGQEESSSREVKRVVELIIDHAKKFPEQTLGVITMGIRHMNRVQAALDDALENRPDLASFFDASNKERFFVKNLERVQGDERDAIIISIGYGKDRAGNLPLHFGPLLPESGRRRLNVAVTRAREKLTVVSSFSHLDIDLSRVRPGSGVELLRNYLQYASSNGKRLGDAEITAEPLNSFEAEVFDSLTAKNLKLIPQMGASRFRIDMVAEHPAKPGRYVLAIECDGATYHSSYTARDRDRLRQQQLENLGWRFHRIWSTDWFMRKEQEIQRAVQAFDEAVRFADRLDNEEIRNNHHESHRENYSPSAIPAKPERVTRPRIPTRTSINQYSMAELTQLIEWIMSDEQLRSDEEILEEMVTTLGFSRRGTRIERAIQTAISQWRGQVSGLPF